MARKVLPIADQAPHSDARYGRTPRALPSSAASASTLAMSLQKRFRRKGTSPLPDRQQPLPAGARPWLVYVLTEPERRWFSISMAKDVDARVFRHRELLDPALKRRTPHLVHVEPFADRHTAIARMKRLRRWALPELRRLIEETNPGWQDLSRPIEDEI